MEAIFASGRIADLILGLVALEAAGLTYFLWRAGRKRLVPGIVANLAAGAALLLALRASLDGGGPVAIGLFLFVALVAHLSDLALRWRDG